MFRLLVVAALLTLVIIPASHSGIADSKRLIAHGKPKKAAIAAVARKLLTAVNAMVRDQKPRQSAAQLQASCC